MNTETNLKFYSPSFTERLKSMLGVDFYRLFHTPMFYIFLAVAAIIPAMVLSMTSMEGTGGAEKMFTWYEAKNRNCNGITWRSCFINFR